MDAELFASFLSRYRPLLVNRAIQVTGDCDIAEDVVQKTSEYLLKNAHRYDPKRAALLTWVLNAVTRRAVDAIRAGLRFVSLDHLHLDLWPGVPHQTVAEHHLAGGETGWTSSSPEIILEREFRRALASRMAAIICQCEPKLWADALSVSDGETKADMARRLGLSETGGHYRLTSAFKRWRKLLKKHFTEAEIETVLGG